MICFNNVYNGWIEKPYKMVMDFTFSLSVNTLYIQEMEQATIY